MGLSITERRKAGTAGYINREKLISGLLSQVKAGGPLVGAEIGVWKGEWVCYLLDRNPRVKKIYGIDPYAEQATFRRHWVQADWDYLLRRVDAKMKAYGNRYELIRERSETCADRVPRLDFLEIDGDHSYHQVKIDIFIYEKKIVSGGVICGHDYSGPQSGEVRRAVDEYSKEKGRDLHFLEGDVGTWWWYVP